MKLLREIDLPWADHKSIAYWIDEQIWGHRVWDNQTPWLIFLEFLGIVDSAQREGKLLDEGGKFYPLLFNPLQRMALRNILYNNSQIVQYILDKNPEDGRAWAEWNSWIKDHARGVVDRDFSYVKDRFLSFEEFAQLLGMLQSATVESESNRRWSSRFLFPFGESCLYEDVNISAQGKPSREYINFGRTGELLYLMLCRSSVAEQLQPHLEAIVTAKNPWNSLVAQLQNDDQPQASTRGQSYLPYTSHKAFDLLGEDLLQLFERGLPQFDAYPHLTLMSAFHVMLYQLVVSSQLCHDERPLMICEIVAPRKTLVRELSIISYQKNSQLSSNAVSTFINNIVTSDDWKKAKAEPDSFPQCKELLNQLVAWPREDDDYDGAHDPDFLIRSLKQSALARHRQHAANVHRSYGRSVGLISKRGTNKLRYAPNDSLLKAMILANVPDRMEFKEFLNRIFVRYGIVIGEREAKEVMEDSDFDNKAFQSNANRLEHRLSSLGMLKRLSDACAYVLNPYAGGSK